MTPLLLAAKALMDPTRVRIVAALRGGELCVCELCDALAISQSTISTHLQMLREADLVVARREGKWNYYAIDASATRLVEFLFGYFADPLTKEKRLRSDATQLGRRLALREQGVCCVGFTCDRSSRVGKGRG